MSSQSVPVYPNYATDFLCADSANLQGLVGPECSPMTDNMCPAGSYVDSKPPISLAQSRARQQVPHPRHQPIDSGAPPKATRNAKHCLTAGHRPVTKTRRQGSGSLLMVHPWGHEQTPKMQKCSGEREESNLDVTGMKLCHCSLCQEVSLTPPVSPPNQGLHGK